MIAKNVQMHGNQERQSSMIESKIYIGLNDLNTNTQLFEKDFVNDIAKDLCAFFHQESVLVTESQIQAHFVRETLE